MLRSLIKADCKFWVHKDYLWRLTLSSSDKLLSSSPKELGREGTLLSKWMNAFYLHRPLLNPFMHKLGGSLSGRDLSIQPLHEALSISDGLRITPHCPPAPAVEWPASLSSCPYLWLEQCFTRLPQTCPCLLGLGKKGAAQSEPFFMRF